MCLWSGAHSEYQSQRHLLEVFVLTCGLSLVQFNIVISVFSTFILWVKATRFVLHCWIPILSVVIHLGLLGLYAASLKFQSTPDMSDPAHPSPGLPWYLSKGCSYATKGNHGYCMQARAVFAMTCVMV